MNKIFTYLELLWHWRMALIPSLYFNLRYLPFKQGVKMPILINKPHLHKMNGKIVIDAAKITTGMIKLGGFGGHMYPNSGIHITQWGGEIIFKGRCTIGNNSFLV